MPDKKPKMWLHSASGYWCIKYQGRRHYLSKDRSEAKSKLDRLLTSLQAEDEIVNRDLSLKTLFNAFYEFQLGRAKSGQIAQDTPQMVHAACVRCLMHFKGHAMIATLTPARFTKFHAWLGTNYTLATLDTTIRVLRMAFKYGVRQGWLREVPSMGECRPPSAKVMRRHKRKLGKDRLFSPEEIQALLASCSGLNRAFVLLGINAGLGPADMAALTWEDIDGQWLVNDRVKTGEPRIAWLWAETVESLSTRGKGLVFPDKWGGPRTRQSVSTRVRYAMQRAGVGHTTYDLRHTFATVGGKTGDMDAVRAVMGHVDTSMLAEYIHDTDRDRVKAVCERVHDWAFDVAVEVPEQPNLRVVG